MSTSLAKQLQNLKEQDQVYQRQFKQNERASILFNFKTAAGMAQEAFNKILINLPFLQQYQEFLFGDQNFNLNREKLTEKENQDYNEQLEQVLIIISQDLLNPNVLKLMEYLLRNFQVNRFEHEYLIVYFLQYHSHAIYIKLLQNINLKDDTKWYNYLDQFVIAGKSISRKNLVEKILQKNAFVLDLLFEYNLKFQKYNTLKDQNLQKVLFIDQKCQLDNQNEYFSLKFFSVLLNECVQSEKTNYNLKLQCKKYVFLALQQITQNKTLNFLNFIIFQTCQQIIDNFFNQKDVQIIIKALIQKDILTSEQKVRILKLISLCCQQKFIIFDSELVNKISIFDINDFKSFCKYYSILPIFNEYLTFIQQNVLNEGCFSEIFLQIADLIQSDRNLVDQEQLFQVIIQNISALVYSASQIEKRSKKVSIFIKRLKQSFSKFSEKLLYNCISYFNCEISKLDKLKQQQVKNNFRNFIKSLFGDFCLYGYQEIQNSKDNTITIQHYTEANQENQTKFIQNLKKKMNDSQDSQVQILKQKLTQALNSEQQTIPQIEQKINLMQTLNLSIEEKQNIYQNLIKKIIREKIIIDQDKFKLFKEQFTKTDSIDNETKAFMTLFSQENNPQNKKEWQKFQTVFFNVNFDQLKNLLIYGLQYKNKQNLIKETIDHMIDYPLNIKITEQKYAYFVNCLKVSSFLLNMIQQLNQLPKDKTVYFFTRLLTNLQKYQRYTVDVQLLDQLGQVLQNECKSKLELNQFFEYLSLSFINTRAKDTPISFVNAFLMILKQQKDSLSQYQQITDVYNLMILKFLNLQTLTDTKLDQTFLKKYTQILNEFQQIAMNTTNNQLQKTLVKDLLNYSSTFTQSEKDAFKKKFKYSINKIYKEKKEEVQNFFNFYFNFLFKLEDEIVIEFKSESIKSLLGFIIQLDYKEVFKFIQKIQKKVLKDIMQISSQIKRDIFLHLSFFYLKNNNYIDYLELLNQFESHITLDQVRQLNSVLNNYPSYLKLITIIKVSPSIDDFELLKFKLEFQDVVLLFKINSNQTQNTTYIKYTLSYLNSMTITTQDQQQLLLLLSLLKICVNDLFESKKGEIMDLIKQIVIAIKQYKNCFVVSNKIDCQKSSIQENEINMNYNTLKKYLKVEIVSDFIADFYQIQQNKVLIDQNHFLNKEIKNLLMDFVRDLTQNYLQQHEAIVDSQNNQFINKNFQYIKTILNYFIIFQQSNEQFNNIQEILEESQQFLTEKKHQNYDKIKNIAKLDIFQQFENLNENQNIVIQNIYKIEILVSEIYLVFMEEYQQFQQNKENQYVLQRLGIQYLQFLDNSMISGFKQNLNTFKTHMNKNIYINQRINFTEQMNRLYIRVFKQNLSQFVLCCIVYFIQNIKNDYKLFLQFLLEFSQEQLMENQNQEQYKIITKTIQEFQKLIYLQIFCKDKNFYKTFINDQDKSLDYLINEQNKNDKQVKNKIIVMLSYFNFLLLQFNHYIQNINYYENHQDQQFIIDMAQFFIFLASNDQSIQTLKTNKTQNKLLQILEKNFVNLFTIVRKKFSFELILNVFDNIIAQKTEDQQIAKIYSSLLKLINFKLESYFPSLSEQQILFNIYQQTQNFIHQQINFRNQKQYQDLYKNFFELCIQIQNKLSEKFSQYVVNSFECQDFMNIQKKVLDGCQNLQQKLKYLKFLSRLLNIDNVFFMKILNSFLNMFWIQISKVLVLHYNINQNEVMTIFDIDLQINDQKLNENAELLEQEFKDCLYLLIDNIKNMLEPYLTSIIFTCAQISNIEYQNYLVDKILETVEPRIVFNHLKNINTHYKQYQVQQVLPISFKLTQKFIGLLDQQNFLEKKEQIFSVLCDANLIVNNIYLREYYVNQKMLNELIQGFVNFSIKCNKKNLKEYFQKLKKKSQLLQQQDFGIYIFIIIHNELMKKLGSYGTFLYEETFELVLEKLQNLTWQDKSNVKKAKPSNIELQQELYKVLSQNLNFLIENDNESFINTYKFEQITKYLLETVSNSNKLSQQQLETFNTYTLQTFQILVKNVNDDYQNKNFIIQLTQIFEDQNFVVRQNALKGLNFIINGLQEKSLFYLNEILSSLVEIQDDEVPAVSEQAKMIKDQLQKFMEEDINDYMNKDIANFDN